MDLVIEKSVKSAPHFFNERHKEALAKGIQQKPPTFEEFATAAKNIMQATKRADLSRLQNLSLKELLERSGLKSFSIMRRRSS